MFFSGGGYNSDHVLTAHSSRSHMEFIVRRVDTKLMFKVKRHATTPTPRVATQEKNKTFANLSKQNLVRENSLFGQALLRCYNTACLCGPLSLLFFSFFFFFPLPSSSIFHTIAPRNCQDKITVRYVGMGRCCFVSRETGKTVEGFFSEIY